MLILFIRTLPLLRRAGLGAALLVRGVAWRGAGFDLKPDLPLPGSQRFRSVMLRISE